MIAIEKIISYPQSSQEEGTRHDIVRVHTGKQQVGQESEGVRGNVGKSLLMVLLGGNE